MTKTTTFAVIPYRMMVFTIILKTKPALGILRKSIIAAFPSKWPTAGGTHVPSPHAQLLDAPSNLLGKRTGFKCLNCQWNKQWVAPRWEYLLHFHCSESTTTALGSLEASAWCKGASVSIQVKSRTDTLPHLHGTTEALFSSDLYRLAGRFGNLG